MRKRKRNISKDKKIEILERIVTAIFGRQEGTIAYRYLIGSTPEITLECDVDDAIKVLGNLSMAEIDYWFYTNERKLKTKLFGKQFEGYTEINLTLEPKYWKEVERLKEEIKRLKEKAKE